MHVETRGLSPQYKVRPASSQWAVRCGRDCRASPRRLHRQGNVHERTSARAPKSGAQAEAGPPRQVSGFLVGLFEKADPSSSKATRSLPGSCSIKALIGFSTSCRISL